MFICCKQVWFILPSKHCMWEGYESLPVLLVYKKERFVSFASLAHRFGIIKCYLWNWDRRSNCITLTVSFAKEIYQTHCTAVCRETYMGWLLERREDVYRNEVKYCMKSTLKAEKQARHLNPCDLNTCWCWTLERLVQGYFIFLYFLQRRGVKQWNTEMVDR